MPWMLKAHIFGSFLMALAVKIVLVTMAGLGATWTNVLVLDWTGLDQKLPQISPWQIQPSWPPCWLWTQQHLKETPREKTWLHANCFCASREQYLITPSSLDAQICSPAGAHLHILDLKATAAGYGNLWRHWEWQIGTVEGFICRCQYTLVIGAPDSKDYDYAGYVVVYRAYDMAKTWCTSARSSTEFKWRLVWVVCTYYCW